MKRVLALTTVFSLSISYANARLLIEDPDSLRMQKQIIEQLDFISENTLPLLDQSISFQALPDLTPLSIQGRLQKLQKDVPLDYNEQVQKYIDLYSTSRYRSYLSRMMGLGKYYFSIYDQIFEKTGLPKEIKYLSIVESALNPHAVSRVGATGPWQFMYATAKMYGLQMDTHIDERKDPVAASYAASKYLTEAYEQFGDWLLAIAAYNCGPGNVTRAIKRSGLENPSYWDLSPFLPKETRNYVPAFIAMTYMMEHHEEYDIQASDVGLGQSFEVVHVQQSVSLDHISEVIKVDEDLIKLLNPAYKRNLIMGTPESPKRLVLPEVDLSYYNALYAVLNEQNLSNPTKPQLLATEKTSTKQKTYKVKRGDTLGDIARKNGVTVQDLRAWNNVKGNQIMPGQQLALNSVSSSKPTSTASNNQQVDEYYIVKSGDTLSEIVSRHKGTTVNGIKTANGLKGSQIKAGMKLKLF